jgi:hypothetical protein
VFGRERVAVGLVLAGPVRGGNTDLRAQDQQLRSLIDGVPRIDESMLQRIEILSDLAQ